MSINFSSGPSEVHLARWSIRETKDGNRHFVGYNIAYSSGRVSTPIKTFDSESRVGRTASGSTYRLVGRAGFDKDAEYVWNAIRKVWKIEIWRDVTPEVVPDWREPLPLSERGSGGSRC